MLDSEQITWLVDITRETRAIIEARAASLTVDEELIIADDILEWEAIRNSYVKFTGDGVDFDNERKRAGIFYRVRAMMGFSFMLYDRSAVVLSASGVYAGGISISDRDARIQNTDRVAPSFTVGTGQVFSNKLSNW